VAVWLQAKVRERGLELQTGLNVGPVCEPYLDVFVMQMTHCHGSSRGSSADRLNVPRSVVVDSAQHVWVADCNNNRIKLLGVDLANSSEVLNASDHKLSGPSCLCLDQTRGLLYVGQRNGKILVFRVLQPEL